MEFSFLAENRFVALRIEFEVSGASHCQSTAKQYCFYASVCTYFLFLVHAGILASLTRSLRAQFDLGYQAVFARNGCQPISIPDGLQVSHLDLGTQSCNQITNSLWAEIYFANRRSTSIVVLYFAIEQATMVASIASQDPQVGMFNRSSVSKYC